MATSIAVASGKGGVGKTSIAVNLALTLSRQGSRVVLFDADFGLANSHILLGVNPKKTAQDILISKTPIKESLSPGPLGLNFLSGGSGLTELLNLEVKARYELIRSFDSLAETTDILVVDVPAGASDSSITFSAAVDRLVVILVGEPTSFMDAYTFIKAASLEAGVEKFSVVVNMVEDEKQGLQHFTKFQAIVNRFLDVKLSYCGHVPFSHRIRQSVVQRKPIMITKQDTVESRAFMGVAKSVQTSPKSSPRGVVFFN